MGVVSLYFPILVRAHAGADNADFEWGVIGAISMGIIFVASPLLGAMTDRADETDAVPGRQHSHLCRASPRSSPGAGST